MGLLAKGVEDGVRTSEVYELLVLSHTHYIICAVFSLLLCFLYTIACIFCLPSL